MTNLLIWQGIQDRFAKVQTSFKLEPNGRPKAPQIRRNKYGEIYTPDLLVDQMVEGMTDTEWLDQTITTHDMCAGFGQFTMGILRKRFALMGESFDVNRYLSTYHLFSELQKKLCRKIIYIFGKNIRILIGDVMHIGELPDDAEKGWWRYRNNKWIDITGKKF